MNKELKPCPFCGGKAWIAHFTQEVCYVLCENIDCMAKQKIYPTEAAAIAAWNARAERKPTDAVREFAERYEKRIAELEGLLAQAERTCRNIAEPDEMSDEPFTCSECGARGPYGDGIYHIGGSEKNEDGSVVFWDAWPVYKYCPNCGARVIEEKGKGNDGE